jgi:hypothetical protein
MKKLLSAAVALSVFAAPAFAQKGQKGDEPLQILEGEKQMETERLDKQYKRTMEDTRKTEATRVDPWSNMRATPSKAEKR